MLDDAQAMAPDERENVLARQVAEMLVPRARRSVRRLDLLRSAEHREGRHLDEQERAARLRGSATSGTVPRRGRARGSTRASRGRDRSSRARRRSARCRRRAGELPGAPRGVGRDSLRRGRGPCRRSHPSAAVPRARLGRAARRSRRRAPVRAGGRCGRRSTPPRARTARPSTRWNRRPHAERFAHESQTGSGRTRRMPFLKSSRTPGAARSTKRWLNSDFTLRDLRVGEVARVRDVAREPIGLDQPELSDRIEAAAPCMRGARVRLGRPRDRRLGANVVEGVGARLRRRAVRRGRERDELVDAIPLGVLARDARTATQRRALPTHFAERGQLRFDVAHRVDAIAARVVEVVRLSECRPSEVRRVGISEDAVRKRLEDDAGAELERGRTQTLHGLADVGVPQRRDAGPRAPLAERRREDELERRALAIARMLRRAGTPRARRGSAG